MIVRKDVEVLMDVSSAVLGRDSNKKKISRGEYPPVSILQTPLRPSLYTLHCKLQ